MPIEYENWAIPFPRSNERGPIEALGSSTVKEAYHRFPRSNERGPIEAGGHSMLLHGLTLFPRSNERGPIEAPTICGLSPTRRRSSVRSYLHGQRVETASP